MELIASNAFKALAPRKYGFGAHFIRLRFGPAQANLFEEQIKDMSILKCITEHKGKLYVNYLYIGSPQSLGYHNIKITLDKMKIAKTKAILATRIDNHIKKAEDLAFKAEMLGYVAPYQHCDELPF